MDGSVGKGGGQNEWTTSVCKGLGKSASWDVGTRACAMACVRARFKVLGKVDVGWMLTLHRERGREEQEME